LADERQAELFVFVGRWSMQKGIDIIADVFFSVLDNNPRSQLICIGPVIDLYGKFAALKLERLMTRFPGRVYSKPEFTALPPYIFSGAEFALIPSRDEPFGLVAVEFGRKGALGVGSKVGGLGSMPGWWYTVESLTSKHLIHQFKHAIHNALTSTQATRAKMRARALIQRFPVQQWVEDLDILQATSIRVNRHQQEHSSLSQNIFRTFSPSTSGRSTPSYPSRAHSPVMEKSGSPAVGPAQGWPLIPANLSLEALPRVGSDQSLHSHVGESNTSTERDQGLPRGRPRTWFGSTSSSPHISRLAIPEDSSEASHEHGLGISHLRDFPRDSTYSSQPSSPSLAPRGSAWSLRRFGRASAAPPSASMLQSEISAEESGADPARKDKHCFSYDAIVHKRNDFELQKVDVTFTDSQNEFYNNFAKKLDKIDAKSSEGRLCIEEFLTKSEKAWFGRFHRAKLGMDPERVSPTTLPGLFRWLKEKLQRLGHSTPAESSSEGRESVFEPAGDQEFLLGDQYEPPSGIRKLLQKKVGDWQLYCFLLAFVSNHRFSQFTSKVTDLSRGKS
jgi:alpha-1,3-glucan synthase